MDHQRFLARFVANERLLIGYLLAATGDIHEAEDILQEVSVALWESFARYDESLPFGPWALGIARHKVMKWRERRGRTEKILPLDTLEAVAKASVDQSAELAERGKLLQRCLEKLPEHSRSVTRLRYGDGLSVPEMAARLGRSVSAMEVMLVRLRRVLRDCIERLEKPAAGAIG